MRLVHLILAVHLAAGCSAPADENVAPDSDAVTEDPGDETSEAGGALTLSPSPVEFGKVAGGETRTLAVFALNTGSSELGIGSVRIGHTWSPAPSFLREPKMRSW